MFKKFSATLWLLVLLGTLTLGAWAQVGVKLVDGNYNEIIYGTGGQSYSSAMVTLTNVSAALTTRTVWVQVLHCDNTSGSAVTLTMENTAGDDYFTAISIPANGVLTMNYNARGLPFVGIKWNAGTNAVLNCMVVGSATN